MLILCYCKNMKRLHAYSQHFLRNPEFVRRLIQQTSISKADVVYDIGAGSGVITSVLADICKQVIAIEAEPATAKLLRKNTAHHTNVAVVENDFLSITLPSTPYKIFANIPFHISSAIVQKVTENTHPAAAAYLIVQKQFSNKLVPNHAGFTSQLGVLLGPLFSVRILKNLKRTDFWPHPNVDTALIEIVAREKPLLSDEDLPAFRRIVTNSFKNPTYFTKLPLEIVSRSPNLRPSSLTLSQWLVLFQAVQSTNRD